MRSRPPRTQRFNNEARRRSRLSQKVEGNANLSSASMRFVSEDLILSLSFGVEESRARPQRFRVTLGN